MALLSLFWLEAIESQRKNEERSDELKKVERELKWQKELCCEKALKYQRKNKELDAKTDCASNFISVHKVVPDA